jgi:outer membrane protein OmpA-like peptidoglycan-associated protein
MWKSGSVQVENFVLSGQALKILMDEGLEYPTPPVHLSSEINSTHEEMTPVVTPNGKEIYFSRRFDPNNRGGVGDLQDIYYSKLVDNRWTKSVNLGSPLNNEGPNAVFSVSPDGNTLLLMNTYTPEGRQKGMGLSISRRTSKGWSMPEDVKMRSFYNKSFYNEYFLSNDGKVILLAVRRDDSFGSRDLYVSFAEGQGIWSEPRNLGEKINTAGTELSPFLAADGKTLYFSSNGHPGFGLNDIFVTRRLDESWTNWTKPANLGKPINSSGTDAYYSIPAAGDFAYYISNHEGLGKNDIFKIELPVLVKPEPVVLVYGKVLNSKTNEPITTGITYHDFNTDNEMGIANSNPDNGYYEIVLPIDKIYSFFAEKKGYYSVQDRLDLTEIKAYTELERDLYLTPIETGQSVKMNNVLFYQSKAQLMPTSYPELDKLARMMAENPTVRIELEGHTDNVGDRAKNQTLSEDRVESVKGYLISKGVTADRITGVGFGGSKPVADNSRELTRRLNRRVEFKILQY